MPEQEEHGPEGATFSGAEVADELQQSQAESQRPAEAARVPRSREELKRIITQRRGESPTEEQLDYIEQAEKDGKWLG